MARSRRRELTVERPTDRLLREGARSLSDAELLAVLLQPGGQSAATLERATSLLESVGGLADLVAGDLENPLPGRGRGAHHAAILALREMAARLGRASLVDRDLFGEPANVANYLTLRYGIADQEVLGALYVDVRNRLIAEREIFRGTLKRTTVETRQIVKSALRCNAAGLILFHTHPSVAPRGAQGESL